MAGMEDCDKEKHDNDNNMITMMMLLLPLLLPDDLKKYNNQLNWEDAVGN
jgi:hypothetical protein